MRLSPLNQSGLDGFTLVKLAAIVGIIGLLAAVGGPALIRNRELAQQRACIENLRQIEEAKGKYAVLEGLSDGDGVPTDIMGSEFLKKMPECPSGGGYKFNRIGQNPECSREGHAL